MNTECPSLKGGHMVIYAFRSYKPAIFSSLVDIIRSGRIVHSNYQPPAPEAIKPKWIENAVVLS